MTVGLKCYQGESSTLSSSYVGMNTNTHQSSPVQIVGGFGICILLSYWLVYIQW